MEGAQPQRQKRCFCRNNVFQLLHFGPGIGAFAVVAVLFLFCFLAQVDLERLGSRLPPASASQCRGDRQDSR